MISRLRRLFTQGPNNQETAAPTDSSATSADSASRDRFDQQTAQGRPTDGGATTASQASAASTTLVSAHSLRASIAKGEQNLGVALAEHLGTDLAEFVMEALDLAKSERHRTRLEECAAGLLTAPNARQLVVAWTTGTRPLDVTPERIAQFAGPTVGFEKVGEKLIQWYAARQRGEAPPRDEPPAPPPEKIWKPLAERAVSDGLVDSEKWKRGTNLANRRGLLGEAMRIWELQDAGLAPGQELIQGIVVVEVPVGLEKCRTYDDAEQWAAANERSSSNLWGWRDADGERHYGYGVTEIDVTLLHSEEATLVIDRVENVKTSNSAAGSAAHQNQTAIEALTQANMAFLFPGPDKTFTDRTSELDRSEEAVARIERATVGPAGVPSYSVQLPLDWDGIYFLAQELGRGDNPTTK